MGALPRALAWFSDHPPLGPGPGARLPDLPGHRLCPCNTPGLLGALTQWPLCSHLHPRACLPGSSCTHVQGLPRIQCFPGRTQKPESGRAVQAPTLALPTFPGLPLPLPPTHLPPVYGEMDPNTPALPIPGTPLPLRQGTWGRALSQSFKRKVPPCPLPPGSPPSSTR